MSSASDREPTHALALTVAYNGSGFSGFARQPGMATVQGQVEDALRTALRRDVATVGAGRTDAGVHALGQVMSLDAFGDEPEARRLRRSLDALSGEGIVVSDVKAARRGFSARFDAVSREYRYRLVTGAVAPLFLREFAWHVPEDLDLEAMSAGASHLQGEHDFRSFCVKESAEGQRTVRRIVSLDIEQEEHLGERCITLRIVGNAFLHSMVRVVVGTLVEVGAQRRPSGWVRDVLSAMQREAAGPTAPAHGLTLWRVEYPDDVWI